VLGAVVTTHITGAFTTGFPAASHIAWWIMAGCGVVVMDLGVLTTSPWAMATARRATVLFDEPVGART